MRNTEVLSGIRTYNHRTEGPPGLALTLMAVEVRIVGTQHETLVMELDGLKTSAGVCGMLCGLGCCNITEVTHLHQEVNSEEQCFWALYARTLKQQTDKQRYLFCKFIHEL